MTLFCKKAQRVNALDREAPRKWVAVLRTTRAVEEKEVVQCMADETTLNPIEAKMAMSPLQKTLIESLKDGKAVKLDDIGAFRLTANSQGVEREETVTADLVERLNIRFTPKVKMKDAGTRSKLTSYENDSL